MSKKLKPVRTTLLFLASFILGIGFSTELEAATTPSNPLMYSNCSNMTISGKKFTSGSGGAAIKLTGCHDVVIEYNEFELDGSIIGVQLQNSYNITIRYNKFKDFRSGVYAVTTTGGIDIHCNEFEDIAGEVPRGQVVQFNKGSGAGNRVNYNTLDHTFGAGDPEDLVNMYGSSGTESDPIQIIGNKFRGGGPSPSGGGIMVGDNGGQNIRVEDNILVDPGQYGIGSPAGHNITIKNNQVYARSQSFTNVGIYVGLKGEIDAGFVCDGPTIEVADNQVNWTNRDGNQNDIWTYSGCPGIIKTNNTTRANIDASILPDQIELDPGHCPDRQGGASSSSSIIQSSSSVQTPSSSSVIVQDPSVKIRLINSSTNQVVSIHSDIESGDTICTDIVGTELSIDAYVENWLQGSEFEKVQFDWNGIVNYRTEGLSPFALDGDDVSTGAYNSSQFIDGENNLVTHLTDVNGISLWSKELTFHTINCEAPVHTMMTPIMGAEQFGWSLGMNTGVYIRRSPSSRVEFRSLNGRLLMNITNEDPTISTEKLGKGMYYVREF
jgi:hypothetical protein